MRDRLVKLLMTEVECQKMGNGGCSTCEYEYADDLCAQYYTEIIADYLLANGVIVPPCKVGDTVWFVQDKKVYFGTVILIRPFIHKDTTTFHGNVEYECEDPFYHDGRTMTHQISVVFQKYGANQIAYPTKEEAERALKEGGAGNGKI